MPLKHYHPSIAMTLPTSIYKQRRQ